MPLPSLSIQRHFATLKDPRRKHRRLHRLMDIIAIALCAVLCGANNWQEVETFGRRRRAWLKRFLPLLNGIPSHDTFERVFDRLRPQALEECLRSWVRALSAALGIDHIAIDGKTARHSGSPARGLGPLQLVSAWATQHSLTLGQVAVEEGSNEITAVPQLLELLELHGAVVTLDAAGCQKDIAAKVREGGGDYVLTVKGNQGHLRDDVEACFVRAYDTEMTGLDYDEHETEEWGHGRHERRCYSVIHDPEGIRDAKAWDGLKVIGQCYSERTVNGETEYEVRYFIGSRRMSAKKYGRVLRNHWRIENTLHWQMDVEFGEDASRVQRRNGATNLALLRRLALSLLKRHPGKESIARKRLSAALDTDFLEEVLAQ
jgi:predicted transposase YbfD/YdcC